MIYIVTDEQFLFSLLTFTKAFSFADYRLSHCLMLSHAYVLATILPHGRPFTVYVLSRYGRHKLRSRKRFVIPYDCFSIYIDIDMLIITSV